MACTELLIARKSAMAETAVSTPQDVLGEIRSDNFSELEVLVSHDLSRFCWKAYQWLGNEHDAEDAVQDALLSAFQHLSEFEGRSKLSTWLTSIVINAAHLQLRRKRRWKTFVQPPFHEEDDLGSLAETIPDKRPGPDEVFAHAELHRLIDESMGHLSAPLRATLMLYYVDGMTLSEVAGVLDIPLGTVKARISRARSRLKREVRVDWLSSGWHFPS
jgi:RNA polymerase sigma factor (sigma-70 family)